MFAVKITEWIFSLKSLGLLTWTCTHLPIVWDKVPNKFVFFLTPSLIFVFNPHEMELWSWDENPLLIAKIVVTVVCPNICSWATAVSTVLNVQASAGVPVDDLSTHKVPLLPLHPVATVELDLVIIPAIVVVVCILIQTFSRGVMLNSSVDDETPKFRH